MAIENSTKNHANFTRFFIFRLFAEKFAMPNRLLQNKLPCCNKKSFKKIGEYFGQFIPINPPKPNEMER